MRNTTTVTVDGDKNLIRALKVIAETRGTTVGKLVREAIDQAHKAEIERAISLFFTHSETQMSQSEQV